MDIYPAIDLQKGKITRLIGGEFGTEQFFIDDVIGTVNKFKKDGVKRIHVIDLDLTKSLGDNTKIIKEIISCAKVETEVGGGIRDEKMAIEMIKAGANKIIIGTKAIIDRTFLVNLYKKIGKNKIIVALDSKNQKIAIKGWDKITNLDPIETGKKLQKYCSAFLFTCIEKEGRMKGTDLPYFKKLIDNLDIPIIASGGISSIEDLRNLKKIGVKAVVIGTAIYNGKINLEKAIEEFQV